MDEGQEVRHRWRIAAERNSIDHISKDEISHDIEFLQKRVDELERNLADALNPYSSRMGKLVDIKDGIFSYMVEGAHVPITDLIEGLKLLSESRLKKKNQVEKNGGHD